MRAALVHDGQVVNLVEVDPDREYDPGDHLEVIELDGSAPVGIGWAYDGESFVAPEATASAPAPSDSQWRAAVALYAEWRAANPDAELARSRADIVERIARALANGRTEDQVLSRLEEHAT